MNVALTYGLVFLAVTLFAMVCGQLMRGHLRTSKALHRRLAILHAEAAPKELQESLFARAAASTARGANSSGRTGLARLHMQIGLSISLSNLALRCFLVCTGLALASGLFGVPLWLALLALPPLTIVAFFFVLRWARNRRIERFSEQLPDAIDVIVRSLKAGHPFTAALGLVASETPEPAGSCFSVLARELGYGLPLERALANMEERIPAPDLRYFSIVLTVHATSGGNLAETLGTLTNVIRERFKMRAKVRALSAEGRFSARLLSVFPLILYGIIVSMAPDYFDALVNTGYVWHFITVCLVLTVIGNLVIQRMVSFDV